MPNWMRNPFGGHKRTPSEEFVHLLTPGNITFVKYIAGKLGPEGGAQLMGTAEQMELWATDEGRATLTDDKALHHARNIRTALQRGNINLERRFSPGMDVLERDGWHSTGRETPDEKFRDQQTVREMIADVELVLNAANTGVPGSGSGRGPGSGTGSGGGRG